jgi:predicted DNA-binding transcriptional regulator AlpA
VTAAFDSMSEAEFERHLHDTFGVPRTNVEKRKLVATHQLSRVKSVRPDAAIRLLETTRAGLVELVLKGKLPPPRIIGDGEVEWRESEITPLRPMSSFLKK